VVVVLTEALAELKQVLLDDQGRMAKLAFDTVNRTLTDEATSPEARLEAVQRLCWVVWIAEDPAWPTDLAEVALVAQARSILVEAPATAARRAVEQAVEHGSLVAPAEVEAEVA
jgi:hypothetical protein